MSASSESFQLGDYLVEEVVSEGTRTRTYRARQVSMNRAVVLERIKPEDASDLEVREYLLADVRAKAAVDHPGIGSVYEAVQEPEAVFYTREFLQGETLEELHDVGVTFAPALIATYLRQLAAAMDYLRQRGIETLPLEPRYLVLGPHDVLRIVNLAVAESVPLVEAGNDRNLVAELFLDLIKDASAGASRVQVLLTAMAEDGGTALSWKEILDVARRLESQLSEGAQVATQAIKSGPIKDGPERSRSVAVGLLAGGVVLAALAAGGLFLNRGAPPSARNLSAMIELPSGRYRTLDGAALEVERFWIDAHEVTIAEYAEFLETLGELPAEKRRGYDHRDQPAVKLDHIPDDWEAILTAARSGGSFDGLQYDPNDPVTGVDWWDGQAYASWKGGRLPSQGEWIAAVGEAGLQPAPRGPVDSFLEDRTPKGIHGLAGNVSEWVLDPAKNPAFPMNPKSPLACGASYLRPRHGAQARTWLPSREFRRPDLGFRIVRGAAP